MIDFYSFIFRGQLADEALDKAGRLKYSPEAIYFSEEIAKKLFLHEIDEKYVQQSKSMITVYTAITAFENATREFVFKTLLGAYENDWWNRGVQESIRSKAQTKKVNESNVKWHVSRGDAMMSFLEFGDLSKIICSNDNWIFFEPFFSFTKSQEWIRSLFEDIEKSRNVIMHSGILDDLDIVRVGINIRDWLHQINA